MDRAERRALRDLIAEVTLLLPQAHNFEEVWRPIQDAGLGAREVLLARSQSLVFEPSAASVSVLGLHGNDTPILEALYVLSQRPELSPEQEETLATLLSVDPADLTNAHPLTTFWRFFIWGKKRRRAKESARRLNALTNVQFSLMAAALGVGVGEPDGGDPSGAQPTGTNPSQPMPVGALIPPDTNPSQPMPVGALIPPGKIPDWFKQTMTDLSPAWSFRPAEIQPALDAQNDLLKFTSDERHFRATCIYRADQIRDRAVYKRLSEISIDTLAGSDISLPTIDYLKRTGLRTLIDVENRRAVFGRIPGVGKVTGDNLLHIVSLRRAQLESEFTLRINFENPTLQVRGLITALAKWAPYKHFLDEMEQAQPPFRWSALSHYFEDAFTRVVLAGNETGQDLFARAFDVALTLASQIPERQKITHEDAWAQFLSDPAYFYSLMDNLGFLTVEDDLIRGGLPEEVALRVEQQHLDATGLAVHLRKYQHFAARFVLAQKKVLIGDEMGLGKTIEALAAVVHLQKHGGTRYLVVCPAAVVDNWQREITSRTQIPCIKIHGPDKRGTFAQWRTAGGIGIMTYEGLNIFDDLVGTIPRIDALIVDEAHSVKNPKAKRSKRLAPLLKEARHAMLLTGTPLENHEDEFRQLTLLVKPQLQLRDVRNPRAFRDLLAPVYLRRRVSDVLLELPDRIEVAEQIPMSEPDKAAYRNSLVKAEPGHLNYGSNSFHEARKAPMLQGRNSAKVQRLKSIVADSLESGRKVVIFSFYLDVLSAVERALRSDKSLGVEVFGPLNGTVPASDRQKIIDEFSAFEGGACLVAQINAGGVGLNIQAASVVIITEPQDKPSTENQAIGRAHRMGQKNTVWVHRLTTTEGLEPKLVERLELKQWIFDQYADESSLAAASLEAVDASHVEDPPKPKLTRVIADILVEEKARLL